MATMTDERADLASASVGASESVGVSESVGARLAVLRRRIEAAGGDPGGITVIAMTKGFGPDSAQAAIDAGLHDLGENYAQELLAKASSVTGGPRWHFLGPVQRNKVAALSPHVSCWQSVDRLVVGEAIARRHRRARCFVQVNVTGEATKHGCRPDQVADLVAELRRLPLDVAGLMTIAPQGPAESARPVFRLIAEMGRQLGMSELSMGMTADLEVAIQEGATMVRIGRGLFGRRDRNATSATVGS
jgi:pyridoxal phosphate enzyme (YggS family)